VVRFVREGYSPVTVVAERDAKEMWSLPAAVGGGEVVTMVAPAPVASEEVEFEGPASYRLKVGGQPFVSLSGMVPGRYRAVRRYLGGISGGSQPVEITSGGSTVVVLEPEDVGGLHVTADSRLCSAATSIRVMKSKTVDAGQLRIASEEIVFDASGFETCALRVYGLPPGSYGIRVDGRDGTLARTSADVQRQVVSAIELKSMTSSIGGQVKLNGRLVMDARVEARAGGGGEPYHAIVAGGQFNLDVPTTGVYELKIFRGALPLVGPRFTVDVQEGFNQVDLDLKGGTVRVRLTGEGVGSDRLRLYFMRDGAPTPTMMVPVVGSSALVEAVGYGTYSVYAESPSHVAARRTFTLDAGRPEVTIDLELRRSTLVVRVSDDLGAPIPNARVLHATGGATEVAIGRFEVSALQPGTEVGASAPGLVPVCRQTSGSGDLEIRLRPGRAVVLELLPAALKKQPLSLISSAPGSCPVPFYWFDVSVVSVSEDGTRRLLFANFTTEEVVTIQTTEGLQTIALNADGVFVVR